MVIQIQILEASISFLGSTTSKNQFNALSLYLEKVFIPSISISVPYCKSKNDGQKCGPPGEPPG
jgi:hypothetical protein